MTKFRQSIAEIVTSIPIQRLIEGRWLLPIMLVTLHFAVWLGVRNIWSRPLLFTHLGLFLLWQPLWRGEWQLSTRRAGVIIGVSALVVYWLNWWVLAFWVSGLFSLAGGRVFVYQGTMQRLRYLLVMVYLLAVVVFWLTPQLFVLPTIEEVRHKLMELVLPLLLLVIALMPHETERFRKNMAVDLFYSLLLFMLLTMLILGSIAFMTLGRLEYFESLLRTVFAMALGLFVLGWIWNPRMGFAGLSEAFSRYFLNIGTPFEQWLKQLANTAGQDISPGAFLEISTGYLSELPWITGLSWESGVSSGTHGEISPFRIEVTDQDLLLVLYTRQRVAPAVLLHIKLHVRLLAFFYQSKRREQRLREMVHLQAVHETGARLTHDLKNMLQSLFALISIAEQEAAQAQPVLRSQLPLLAQRIEQTLNKLKASGRVAELGKMPLPQWWDSLQQRQQFRNLEWVEEGNLHDRIVPTSLFDSIADNLIENARNKRMREPDIMVRIRLTATPLTLSVCDSGSAIPAGLAGQLMQTVIASDDGLGMGLFQAARWAEQSGYILRLSENKSGRVCFELAEIPGGNMLEKSA